mmetsp:Transcript_56322/g.150361  ORF Transcript_56322/g.150361 Transcript_56322/m.150361 type:complete len:210 (-) Transcript_56322:2098-2727(-)
MLHRDPQAASQLQHRRRRREAVPPHRGWLRRDQHPAGGRRCAPGDARAPPGVPDLWGPPGADQRSRATGQERGDMPQPASVGPRQGLRHRGAEAGGESRLPPPLPHGGVQVHLPHDQVCDTALRHAAQEDLRAGAAEHHSPLHPVVGLQADRVRHAAVRERDEERLRGLHQRLRAGRLVAQRPEAGPGADVRGAESVLRPRRHAQQVPD